MKNIVSATHERCLETSVRALRLILATPQAFKASRGSFLAKNRYGDGCEKTGQDSR